MDFTPIIPTTLTSEDHLDLSNKAIEVYSKTLSLTGSLSPLVIQSLKNMLRSVNCYYSNHIEAEGTHPADIEKAMKEQYSKNADSMRLQKLALSYINTQKMIVPHHPQYDGRCGFGGV